MSVRARAVAFVLRHSLKRVLAHADSVAMLRGALASGPYRVPGDVYREAGNVAGVAGDWVWPRDRVRRGTLL